MRERGKNKGVAISRYSNDIQSDNQAMRSQDMPDKEFESLLSACSEVAELFPDGIVFIGGIAVYMHATNLEETKEMAEFTHDADFYISLAAMADLRDMEEVTQNRRLSRHQMIKRGFDFDIYTERHSSLIVPYDMVAGYSALYEGIRVASLEHLLVLKLEAFLNRKGSSKGEKDAKDLLRIGAVAARGGQSFRPELAAPFMRDEHLKLLELVYRGPYATSLAQGNAVQSKRLRGEFSDIADGIRENIGCDRTTPPPKAPRHRM